MKKLKLCLLLALGLTVIYSCTKDDLKTIEENTKISLPPTSTYPEIRRNDFRSCRNPFSRISPVIVPWSFRIAITSIKVVFLIKDGKKQHFSNTPVVFGRENVIEWYTYPAPLLPISATILPAAKTPETSFRSFKVSSLVEAFTSYTNLSNVKCTGVNGTFISSSSASSSRPIWILFFGFLALTSGSIRTYLRTTPSTKPDMKVKVIKKASVYHMYDRSVSKPRTPHRKGAGDLH